MYFWPHCGFRQQWTAIRFFCLSKWNGIVPPPVVSHSKWRQDSQDEGINQPISAKHEQHSLGAPSSAVFTLDCCHGSASLPTSLHQGRSVWQRYCLPGWFTFFALASIAAECESERASERRRVAVPKGFFFIIIYLFIFFFPPFSLFAETSREERAYESSTRRPIKAGLHGDLAFKAQFIYFTQ